MLPKFFNHSQNYIRKNKKLLNEVLDLDETMSKLSDIELKSKTTEFKNRYNLGESLDDLLPEAFAVCREAAWRVLGMKHFPVQVLGGIILHKGNISEMKTGEGKTLVVTLPAYLNALTEKGVHIVTVNEYLAKRDEEQMGKVFQFLGLSVGFIFCNQTAEDKRNAYNCDIVYGTNSEFGFDYLRDHLAMSSDDKVQRDLNYAVIDEVDSILIDEARTPLIITRPKVKPSDMYIKANDFILSIGKDDYKLNEKEKAVTLTDQGIHKVEEYFGIDNLGDLANMDINYHVNVALKAHLITIRDVDYIIEKNQVILIDHFTGRLAIGKIYNDGIQQGIQAKEGLEISPENATDATITYQNYFRMYNKISGMTGTALTESAEFEELYYLEVIEIPTNKPVIRIDNPDIVYKSEKGKFQAIVNDIKERYYKGQPVLVGTVDVEKSELVSNLLKKEGIPHQVLNAKFHEKEAYIIAQAGRYKIVTIATNMAGRGTDILLGGNPVYLAEDEFVKIYGFKSSEIPEDTDSDEKKIITSFYNSLLEKYKIITKGEKEKVISLGGLYVIGTERHEARRIDNQLRGRSGRQGDPGESCFYLSLEDNLLRLFGGDKVQSIANKLDLDEDTPISSKFLSNIVENSQKKMEGMNYESRKQLMKFDNIISVQRNTIYKDRSKIIASSFEEIKEYIRKFSDIEIKNLIEAVNGDNQNDKPLDLELLKKKVYELFDINILLDTESLSDIEKIIHDGVESKLSYISDLAEDKQKPLEYFQQIILSNVDEYWKSHVDNVAELRKNMGMRNHGNMDPFIVFHFETNAMYEEMVANINYSIVKQVYHCISKEIIEIISKEQSLPD